MNAVPGRHRPRETGASDVRLALRRLRPFFARAAWFSIIASLLILTSTWYMLEVYERVVNSRNHLTLLMLTLVVLVSNALMEVLEWAHGEVMREAGLALDRLLGRRVFDASIAAKVRGLPGGGTLQPLQDLRTLRDFLPSPLIKSVIELPVALVFLAILFAIGPLLGVAGLLGAVAQTLVTWLNERATRPLLSEAGRQAIAAQQEADGAARNAQVIAAMGMRRDVHRRWFEKQGAFLRLQALASDRAGLYASMSRFLQLVLGSALMGLAAYLLLNRELAGGAGMLIVSAILGGRVLQPLVAIVTQWRSAVAARDAVQRLEALFEAVPAKPAAMPLPAPRGRLTVEGVIAAAPGTNMPILRGIAFGLQPGEVLAVTGPSASGKTSLARVLVGLWPSVGGKARLDGVDLYAWDKAELGPHLGYLPQDVELLDGTVAENIARFGAVDRAKVEAAARAVAAHDFVMSLPDGYDTDIGPDGARLSGGQRQRIGLARALYGEPVFLVLDEPNASLDEQGEAALAEAIAAAKARGATVVAITHRTALLAVADRMLVMRDGQAALFGARDEVLEALQRARTAPPRAAAGAVQPAGATA